MRPTENGKAGKTALIVTAAVLLVVLGVLYVRHVKEGTDSQSAAVSPVPVQASPYSTEVSGYVLTLSKDGTPVQTLTLGEDATAGMDLIAGSTVDIPPFITAQDVNGDGYPDVAMLTGIGYGGVNAFYDYSVFDPSTGRFAADPVLMQICNPVFDPAAKTITGDAKDGQDSWKTVYTFLDGAYVKGPTVSDSTGQVEVDD